MIRVFTHNKNSFDALVRNRGLSSDNVETEAPHAFYISINDTCGTDQVPYFENRENVLVLFFDDVTEDIEVPVLGSDITLTVKAFTIEQAREVIHFLEKQKGRPSCVVHSAVGIARSGALGEFVNDYFNGDYHTFKRQNPRILPNGMVLRLLKQAWKEIDYP